MKAKPLQEDALVKDVKTSQVPWAWWAGLGFVVLAYYSSQFIAAISLYLFGLARGWSQAQTSDWLNASLYAQFMFILLTETIVIGGIYLFVRQYKVGMQSIGLRKPRWSDLGHSLIIVPAYFIVYLVAVGVASKLISGFDASQAQDIGFKNVHGGTALFVTFLSLVVLPPITEEIMVRGLLYSSLKKAMPVLWATLVTSLLFAVPHLLEGGSGGLLYVAGLDTFILSLFLVYLREKTGGLWSSMILHAIKNGTAFMVLFVLHRG